MPKRWIAVVSTALALVILLMSGTARAQTTEVIAYDGFEDGLNGGFGWASGWRLTQGNGPARISDTRPYRGTLSLEMLYDNAQRPIRIPAAEGQNVVLRFWLNHDIVSASANNPIFIVIITTSAGYDYLLQIFLADHPAGMWKQYEVSLTSYGDGSWRSLGFYPFTGVGARYLDEIEILHVEGSAATPLPTYTPVASAIPSTPGATATAPERIELCGEIQAAAFVGDASRPVVLTCDVTVLNPYVFHTGHGQEIYLCGFDLRAEGYALITHGAVHPGCP